MRKEEVFRSIKEIMYEVAPAKIVEEITYESSPIEDFAFDSMDVMDMFIKIQERYGLYDDNFNDLLTRGKDGFDVRTLDAICNTFIDRI